MKHPVISIVIPCYNCEKYILGCLKSLIEQDYQNWEAILIDDGSSDFSYQVLTEFSKNEPRIRVYGQNNQGAALTRLRGISLSKGEFITFIDADDTIDSNFLSLTLKTIRESNVDIVVTELNLISGNKSKCFRSYKKSTYNSADFLKKTLTGWYGWELCGKLYKKKLFEKDIYTPSSISIGEDAIQYFQILCRTNKIQVVQGARYNYVQHLSSMSKKKSIKFAEQTIQAAEQIDHLLRELPTYTAIKKEINSMYLLFYSNATKRTGIFWTSHEVLQIYDKHLNIQSLLLIPKLKAMYVLFSLLLAKILSACDFSRLFLNK